MQNGLQYAARFAGKFSHGIVVDGGGSVVNAGAGGKGFVLPVVLPGQRAYISHVLARVDGGGADIDRCPTRAGRG